VKEATYDEETDTWKRPWWANAHDDGNMPYRQLPFNLRLGIDLSEFLVGVRHESYQSEWYWQPTLNYRQTWITLHLGPLWIQHERYQEDGGVL
jgi:hypothetical protein